MKKIIIVLVSSLLASSLGSAGPMRSWCSDASQQVKLYAFGMDEYERAWIKDYKDEVKEYSLALRSDKNSQSDAVIGRGEKKILTHFEGSEGCREKETATFAQFVKIQDRATKQVLFEGNVICDYLMITSAGGGHCGNGDDLIDTDTAEKDDGLN